ncbi:MAG TPA: hypothetical protein PKG71_02005 [Candidatus Woesebacteria bacterium]|nr:hypothetical protein [Candidatus Woesebacteria bacterium]HNS94718.1 hypothetical protein [Candidatus Woesebacteria bacterium]
MADNSTSIVHLLDDTQKPASPPPPSSPAPISTGATKESGPGGAAKEQGKPSEIQEQPVEISTEQSKEKPHIKHKKNIPDIHPDAAKAGLQVAPSASPFPTIYDIKVPVLSDEQIEQNLHKNFWTGARWLAELCKYLLLQAHVRVKKIGQKVVRERLPERF